MTFRVLLSPQLQQKRRHGPEHCPGAVNLGMAARAKRNHQGQHRLAGHPMMHDHLPFASPRSVADAATIAVTLKNCLPQAPEIFGVLPLEAVATHAESAGKNLLPPTPTVQRTLDCFPHAYITNRCFSSITVTSASQP